MNKKANSVIPLTFTFFIFNLIIFILISAFAMDGNIVGNKGSFADSTANESLTSNIFLYDDASFMDKYLNTLFGLPWWLNTIFISLNTFMLIVIILGWIRGV